MALVMDCLNANKPATSEPKQGKLRPTKLNINKDREVDLKKEGRSFFGRFVSSAKSPQQKTKKGPDNGGGNHSVMSRAYICTATASHPSTCLELNDQMNGRETLETEDISAPHFHHALHYNGAH